MRALKSIISLFFLLSVIAVVFLWPAPAAGSFLKITGRFVIMSSFFLVLYFFLRNYYTDILSDTLKTLFILILILAFVFLTGIAVKQGVNFVELIPYALIPVIIRTFYDQRLAVFILIITVFLTGFFLPRPFESGAIIFFSGMAALFTLTNPYRKGGFFFASLAVAVSSAALYTAFILMKDGSLAGVSLFDYLLFAGNGLLVLLTYPLVFIFERKFMFISGITLLELSDTNQPLLRKLSEEAPGSFQHSLQVANLAEEAARITGANHLLARAGALYHDIGKIANPLYYSENQKNGESPHDGLEPEESARIIINHVNSGIVLARNFRVPPQIIDFIKTHHGTTVAYYFFRKYVENQPSGSLRENVFSYPGPRPFSKETAIVMMADAVEAASRSLLKQTEESISELVERIVLLQEQSGQFSGVPFTYRDMSEIKEVFKKRLSTMYHGRIAYN